MAGQSLRIAVLHYLPPEEKEDPVVGQVREALQTLGHEVTTIGVNESARDLLREIEKSKCDLVFNICETFADDYRLEVNVAALLELARVNFTGSGTAGLLLAQDKILTKQILDYHEISTPRFATFDGVTFETRGSLSFPLIVKPAKSDASIGLEIVNDWDGLTRKIREIRKGFDDDALAEEFIDGREIYVGVIGDARRPDILPIIELDFGANWDKTQPQIADRDVKFGPETEGSPRLVIAEQISDELRGRIERSALLAYRALKLRDYARIDFRVASKNNEPYVLEVNPNPYLEAKSELALAAQRRGISYTQLIGRVVDSAAARYKLYKKQPAATPEHKPEHAADDKGTTAAAGDVPPLTRAEQKAAERAEQKAERAEQKAAERAEQKAAEARAEGKAAEARQEAAEARAAARSDGNDGKPARTEARADARHEANDGKGSKPEPGAEDTEGEAAGAKPAKSEGRGEKADVRSAAPRRTESKETKIVLPVHHPDRNS